ncbi:dihydrofolate reductase family protein [Streptosporangium sp. NPDC000396]|uniref:dihydrofolate reductase family protein n=1 Tax=Streptosporangium sp. NPDC000396 TaxID=3366185 RepID=UPI0036C95003
MRKIVAAFFMSLDGVVEAPQNWHFPYFNEEMGEAVGAQASEADAMLLGRRTYEEFAAHWADKGSDVPFADHINNTTKFVVSSTLETAEWRNSTLIRDDVAGEIAELKQQPGKNILVNGSATLVRSLLRDNLLDELRLLVHPIIVGSGQRLFADGAEQKGLKLIESKTFSTGVLSLAYHPA